MAASLFMFTDNLIKEYLVLNPRKDKAVSAYADAVFYLEKERRTSRNETVF